MDSVLGEAMTTSAPFSAKRTAIARPLPEAAPVTTATLPSSFPIGNSSGRLVAKV
jgi:hypothetical protein